jgi:hypothetical protein
MAQCFRKLATPQIKRRQAAAVESSCQQHQSAKLDAAFGEEFVVVHWGIPFRSVKQPARGYCDGWWESNPFQPLAVIRKARLYWPCCLVSKAFSRYALQCFRHFFDSLPK